MRRTPEEWRELIRQLRVIVENPKETRERKRKAQDILDGILRHTLTSHTDYMRRREGTQRTTRYTPKTDDEDWSGIV